MGRPVHAVVSTWSLRMTRITLTMRRAMTSMTSCTGMPRAYGHRGALTLALFLA